MSLLLARASTARLASHREQYCRIALPRLSLSCVASTSSRSATSDSSTSAASASSEHQQRHHEKHNGWQKSSFDKTDEQDPWRWARYNGKPQRPLMHPSPPSSSRSPPSSSRSPPSSSHPPPFSSLSSSRFPRRRTSSTVSGVTPIDHDDSLARIQSALRAENPQTLARLLLTLSGHPSRPVSEILLRLQPTEFSALLQTLDPLRCGPLLDPAHGLHIAAGLEQYSRVAKLNNRYGVRHVHIALFPVLLAAFHHRLRNRRAAVPDDYKVLLRCAGACQNVQAVRTVWKLMDVAGHTEWRNTELFTDFIQARFLTLPLYYQFDRARVRLRPGDLYRSTTALPSKVRRRLDHLRASLNLHRWQPHGVVEKTDGDDETPCDSSVSRLLRAQGPVGRVSINAMQHGAIMDEKLFCAILIAWSRTGARRKMKELLHRHYGIKILENWDVLGFRVVMDGAFPFKADGPRRPTAALLHAVVDAFGTTGDIKLGVNLAVNISSRWDVAMTHEVWSSILRWAYLSGAKPFSTEWKIVRMAKPRWRGGPLEASQVRSVWSAMMASPADIKPTWSDTNIYVRILINSNDLGLALDTMLEARKRYDELMEKTTRAFHALQEHQAIMGECTVVQTLHFDWQRCRLRLDLARNDIVLWVTMWLKKHSQQRIARESMHETHRLIPRMVLAFKEWLPFPMKYRTATGHVRLFIQGDPTAALDRAGASVLAETQRQIDLLRADGHTDRAQEAEAFAKQHSHRLDLHRAARPPGRTLEPGQDVPLQKTIFVQPPPTTIRKTVPSRWEGTPAKGRKVSVPVQPWVRRKVRMPWTSPPAEADVDMRFRSDTAMLGEQEQARRDGGRIWLEPVHSGDVEEDIGIKPHAWLRRTQGLDRRG